MGQSSQNENRQWGNNNDYSPLKESMSGATQLNQKMRVLGFEVFDPDMSMFTLGGGGVHCLAQALCRDNV